MLHKLINWRKAIDWTRYVLPVNGIEWVLTRNNRLCHGLVTGPVGAGKTHTLETIVAGAVKAGLRVWVADTQHTTTRALNLCADRTATGVDGTRLLLQHAYQVLQSRKELQPNRPTSGMLVVIDECGPAMGDQQCRELVLEIAREGGPYGVAVIVSTADASLAAFGGVPAARELRQILAADNMLALSARRRHAPAL